jgi:RNA polymerase sigma factor (sigma-70 family)
MTEHQWLADRFEEQRSHLRAVAYRMLGSLSEAEDAVQEGWIRLSRADTSGVENIGAWMTTIVARICLNMLQSRKTRREEPLEVHMPDPVISRAEGSDPEQQALLADSVGLALLVVLEALTPAERVAFVLHDVFAVPFEDIAPIVGRSPMAARQLASRARRRVQGAPAMPDVGVSEQRAVVDAFLAAARGGDFDGLLAVLDPEVVLRADDGREPVLHEFRGAREVASRAAMFSRFAAISRPALVNGVAGVVAWGADGNPLSVMAFTVVGGKIVAIDSLTDPVRLARLDLTALANA